MGRANCALQFGECSILSSLYFIFSPSNWVGHDGGKKCDGYLSNVEYQKVRMPKGKDWDDLVNEINKLWYQRNYLKCLVDLGV